MSATIDPNTPLSVTLPARQMNVVFAAMSEHASAVIAIMQDMQRQCLQQSQLTENFPMPPPLRPNGEVHDAS